MAFHEALTIDGERCYWTKANGDAADPIPEEIRGTMSGQLLKDKAPRGITGGIGGIQPINQHEGR